MSQSLAKILVHTVFSTKERRTYLKDLSLRNEMHHYLGGILSNLNCQPIIVGGVEDHVHLLCALSRTCEPAEMVKEVNAVPPCGLRPKAPVKKISVGKMDMACFRLVFRRFQM